MKKDIFKFWDADEVSKAKAENAAKPKIDEKIAQSNEKKEKKTKKSAKKTEKPAKKEKSAHLSAENLDYCEKNAVFSFKKCEGDGVLSRLFDGQEVEREIFENFDKILQDIAPIPAEKMAVLPRAIHELSLLLTAEREDFRAGYMNETKFLAAYSRYFLWWNILRLSSVFAALKNDFFKPLDESAIIFDAGSGPLAAPISLWLSRPELREKKLSIYCVDTSRSILDLGEGIFSAICAKFGQCAGNWKIIKVREDLAGVRLRQKAGLVVCANTFNELNERNARGRAIDALLKNCASNCSIFIAEPGTPISALILTRARSRILSGGFRLVSPCPHAEDCPMVPRGAKRKWCHFSIDAAKTAPERLKALSEKSRLPKDRATISFLAATKGEMKDEKKIKVRIISDKIRLENSFGRYGCCKKGLVLVEGSAAKECEIGELIEISQGRLSEKDQKSGAFLVRT